MWRTREALSVLIFFSLVCAGSARAQDVSLLPTSLTFSNEVVGSKSTAQTVTLTNTDEENALTISSIVASGDFTQTNTCGSSVAAGESCAISVKFAPKATGAIDGSITISDNAPRSPQVFALSGTSIAQETLSTPSFDFGQVTVGQTSEVETITLTNHTAAAITISSIKASADFVATPAATGGCGTTLAANSSCSVTVVFVPTEPAVISGSLIFSDAGTQQYVLLDGEGEGTADSPITLTPATLTFANQTEGTTSAAQSVTIKNTGTTSLALTFAASGSFSKSNPTSGACGGTLAGGASCAIDVKFTPAVLGYINGGISVTYSGANSPQVVSLTGIGIGQVTVSPSSLPFPAQQVGSTSAAKTVTVTNNSAAAISVTSIVKSADFTQTNTCGSSIAAGKTCTVSISFAPTGGGSVLGSVILTDSATNSPQVVDLSGIAFLNSRFAYVANPGSGTVSIYTVNVETGQLRNNGYVLAGSSPMSVTVDPLGRFAYVPNFNSNNVFAFTINATTGDLTPVTGSPFAAEDGPQSVTVDPSGKFVYVAHQTSNNISAYTIDGATGALTPVSGSPFLAGSDPNSMAIDPSGKFLYVGNQNDSPGGDVSGYTINAATGALTAMAGSPFLSGSGAFTLAFAPSGEFGYVTAFGSLITAFSINPTSGIPSPINGSPFNFPGGNSMAIAPSGNFIYVADEENTLEIVTVDTATGALTAETGVDTGSNPSSVTVDPSGSLVYVTNQGPALDGNGYFNDVWIYSIGSNGLPTSSTIASTQQEPASLALAGGTSSITYTPKFAYVANQGSSTVASTVSAYKINASTGKLTAVSGSPFADGGASTFALASSVAVDPSGRFVYVANTAGSVAEYKIDSSSGALTAIAGSPIADTDLPVSVAVDPSGRFVYAANTPAPTISEYTIGASTGALTAISGSPLSTGANSNLKMMAVDPTGQFLYATVAANGETFGEILAFAIDSSSGALSAVTGSPLMTNVEYPSALAVDPSGQFLYVTGNATGDDIYVYDINPATGAPSYSNEFSAGPFSASVAVNPLDNYVYVPSLTGNYVETYSLANGDLKLLTDSPFGAGANPISVAVDPSGKFVYVANNGDNDVTAYKINAKTGDLIEITGQSAVPAGTSPISVVTTGTIH